MRRSLSLAILPLAGFETLIWAALFYSFPALLPVWEADLGWSRSEISGALTLSMIITAFASPRMGTLIDRGQSRAMLVWATVAGGVLLIALSLVEVLWQFWLVWALIGVVNACVLYEACFAIITVTVGSRARQAITVVTLVAGFAGTVSFPASHLLSEAIGWRAALQVFAAVTILVCLPLAAWGLRVIENFREEPEQSGQTKAATRATMLRKPAFWWVALGFASMGLIHGMIISHIRPILGEYGLAMTTAVMVASMMGPMQVVGRIVIVALGNRIDTFGATIGALAGVVLGLLALAGGNMFVFFAVIFVVPYSASYGVISIVRPVLAAEFLGRNGFGLIAGMLALPYVLAGAVGPILSAWLWSLAGYDLVLGLSGALVLFSIVALFAARRDVRNAA